MNIPANLEPVRAAASAAIAPLAPSYKRETTDISFWLGSGRTRAGQDLPEYYLVYFLLVDLLEFRNLGQWEKSAWCVPLDYNGILLTVEHRKFGLGLFVPDPEAYEGDANEVVQLIKKGVTAAAPFFSWLAEQAVLRSHLNVVNRSSELFNRYKYLLDEYRKKSAEATARKDETIIDNLLNGGTIYSHPAFRLRKQAQWLAISAVEAFFSWSEHIFIHLAILEGRISTGSQVADLADSDWQTKFKTALDLAEPKTNEFYQDLLTIRRQVRNFVAHGAFGKQGEAFSFHSGAGAVPLLLPHRAGEQRFRLVGEATVDDASMTTVMEEFVEYLWSSHRESAEIYIQQSDLPTILTMAADGTYKRAMSSPDEMQQFVEVLSHSFDNAANMDW